MLQILNQQDAGHQWIRMWRRTHDKEPDLSARSRDLICLLCDISDLAVIGPLCHISDLATTFI